MGKSNNLMGKSANVIPAAMTHRKIWKKIHFDYFMKEL